MTWATSLRNHLRRVHQHNVSTIRSSPLSELSGSLGDLGTLLPLMLALTLSGSISLSSTLVFSGLANILTGLIFGIPLPVQPMKAIASIAITNHFSKTETASAGLFVGGVVLIFSLTGLLSWFTRVVPTPVVRGIQVGAGLSLVISAGSSLLQSLGWTHPSWSDNHIWTVAAFLGLLFASLRPRIPYALLITVLGLVLAVITLHLPVPTVLSSSLSFQQLSTTTAAAPFWLWHPTLHLPTPASFRRGALEAGLPQLPLTTLNSILAVSSLAASLTSPFPSYPSTTALGLSVALANLVGPWFGAMPVCHGSGGLAGQYRFGARSGASVVVLGLIKVVLGLVVGEMLVPLLRRFPGSLLGVMVIAAGVELAKVGRDPSDQTALWESAAGGEGGQGLGSGGAKMGEGEEAERWTVLLITVAGCLAFKNDAVGFAAGMLWHWGLQVDRKYSSGGGFRGWLQRRGAHGEREPLLS